MKFIETKTPAEAIWKPLWEIMFEVALLLDSENWEKVEGDWELINSWCSLTVTLEDIVSDWEPESPQEVISRVPDVKALYFNRLGGESRND